MSTTLMHDYHLVLVWETDKCYDCGSTSFAVGFLSDSHTFQLHCDSCGKWQEEQDAPELDNPAAVRY